MSIIQVVTKRPFSIPPEIDATYGPFREIWKDPISSRIESFDSNQFTILSSGSDQPISAVDFRETIAKRSFHGLNAQCAEAFLSTSSYMDILRNHILQQRKGEPVKTVTFLGSRFTNNEYYHVLCIEFEDQAMLRPSLRLYEEGDPHWVRGEDVAVVFSQSLTRNYSK